MISLITDCCRGLHTGVGFGQTPVRPHLIVEEGDPERTLDYQDTFFLK